MTTDISRKPTYARYQLVRSSSGDIVDATFLYVNKEFMRFFKLKENPCGRRRSELFADSNPMVCSSFKRAMSVNEPIDFPYFQSDFGHVDVIVEYRGNDVMSITTMANIRLHERESECARLRKSTALLLSVHNAIVWRWDLERHEIISNTTSSPLQMSNYKTYDEFSELIVWDEQKRLDFVHPDDRQGLLDTVEKFRDGTIDRACHHFRVACEGDVYRTIEMRACVEEYNCHGKASRLLATSQFVNDNNN